MIITRRADIIRHINIITLDGVVMTEHRYRLRKPWLFARKFHIESLHTLRVHDGTCIGIVYTCNTCAMYVSTGVKRSVRENKSDKVDCILLLYRIRTV